MAERDEGYRRRGAIMLAGLLAGMASAALLTQTAAPPPGLVRAAS